MKTKIAVLLLIFSTINLAAKEKVRNYKEQTEFVETMDKYCSTEVAGTLKYGNDEYAIYKIRYNQNKTMKQKKYLIITGVHGNEPAPVLEIRDFIIELNRTAPVRKNLEVDFLYIVNPYGFEFNERYNGNKEDVNRDLHSFKTKEAQIIKESFDKKEYEKVFDFHEASSKHFFLYCYGIKNKKYANKILQKLEKDGVLLESEYKDKILQAKKGMLFVPFYASEYMKLNDSETIGIYFKGCRNTFTFETSKYGKMDDRRKIIRSILHYILSD